MWVNKLEQDRVLIDNKIPAARELKKQLESFSGKVRASGSVAYEAQQVHDDYISCLLFTIAASKSIGTFNCPHFMTCGADNDSSVF